MATSSEEIEFEQSQDFGESDTNVETTKSSETNTEHSQDLGEIDSNVEMAISSEESEFEQFQDFKESNTNVETTKSSETNTGHSQDLGETEANVEMATSSEEIEFEQSQDFGVSDTNVETTKSSETNTEHSQDSGEIDSNVEMTISSQEIETEQSQESIEIEYTSKLSTSSDETRYSLEQKIEEHIKKCKEQKEISRRLVDEERRKYFEEMLEEMQADPSSIFNLEALRFSCFSHEKIKFIFTRALLDDYYPETLTHHCSLVYNKRYRYWFMKTDSLPIPLRRYFINFFLKGKSIRDEQIIDAIYKIYDSLCKSVQEHIEICLDKLDAYKEQKDLNDPLADEVFFTEYEEEVFFSPEEVNERRTRVERIHKRMIPPEPRTSSSSSQEYDSTTSSTSWF